MSRGSKRAGSVARAAVAATAALGLALGAGTVATAASTGALSAGLDSVKVQTTSVDAIAFPGAGLFRMFIRGQHKSPRCFGVLCGRQGPMA